MGQSKVSGPLRIDKDDNFHDALVSAQHSALLSAPSSSSSLGQSGVHLSSDLGESFMMLKPSVGVGVGVGDDRRQSQFNHNTPSTFSGERLHVDTKGVVATNRNPLLPRPPAAHDSRANQQQQQPDGTWTNTMMAWGGFGASVNTPPVSTAEEVEDPHAAPSWNEQSVFVSSAGDKNVSVASRTQNDPLAQSTTSGSGDLSRSTISVLNLEAQSNLQGVANLLQTVKRLGDENAQLVSRLEQIKAEKDLQLRQIQSDVGVFKQDYIDKFRRVKSALRDYTASHQREDNPALQGSLSATNDLLKEAEERLTRAREALAAVESQQQQYHSNKAAKEDGKFLIENAAGTVLASSSSSSSTSDAEKRQRDLERTVQALVGRLQKANDDNKRKDILLRTLDPSYVSASVDTPSGLKPTHSSHRSSSSSSVSKNAPPLQHPVPPGSSGIASGGKGIAMNSPGAITGSSGSGRVPSGPAIGSPTPKKQSVPSSSSSASAMSKHPSTATLEALQQKANK
eukprot:gene22374-28496_t